MDYRPHQHSQGDTLTCACNAYRNGMATSDAPLVGAIKAGDARALGELYDRHSPMVYGFCLQLVKDQVTAEGLLEEAFWRLWQIRSHLRSPLDSVLHCLLAFAAREASAIERKRENPVVVTTIDVDPMHQPQMF